MLRAIARSYRVGVAGAGSPAARPWGILADVARSLFAPWSLVTGAHGGAN